MRVLVCGGRRFSDVALIETTLANFTPGVTCVIVGGASGADEIAFQWALRNVIPTAVYFADWARHGRSAGPKRNARMLTEGKPDVVLAFTGGRGTADMVRKAKAAGVKVYEVAR